MCVRPTGVFLHDSLLLGGNDTIYQMRIGNKEYCNFFRFQINQINSFV